MVLYLDFKYYIIDTSFKQSTKSPAHEKG